MRTRVSGGLTVPCCLLAGHPQSARIWPRGVGSLHNRLGYLLPFS